MIRYSNKVMVLTRTTELIFVERPAMNVEAFENNSEEAPAQHWGQEVFTWSSLLALGFILFELTYQPAIGTVALCLKFCWKDFKTASWLWRVDPWRARGRACWWRTALVAFFTNLVIIFGSVIFDLRKQAQPKIPDRLLLSMLGAGLTSLIGFTLAGMFAVVAILIARRNRIRLWFDGSLFRTSRRDIWPPFSITCSPRNKLVYLLISTAFPLVLFLSCFLAILFINPRGEGDGGRFLLSMAVIIGLFLWACIAICKSVEARTPGDCWPLDEEIAELQDDLIQ